MSRGFEIQVVHVSIRIDLTFGSLAGSGSFTGASGLGYVFGGRHHHHIFNFDGGFCCSRYRDGNWVVACMPHVQHESKL